MKSKSVSQADSTSKSGRLFIIGGKAAECVKHFVDFAGGAEASVLIVPFASGSPDEVADDFSVELAALGVKKITVADAVKTGNGGVVPFSIPAHITAVYMSGGDQERLVEGLGASGAKALRRFYKRGGLVAGTSAGAAAVSPTMIAGGMGDKQIRAASLELKKGLNLLPRSVVDTHFLERGRHNRLIAAAHLLPSALGIGIDEDTGALISVLESGERQLTVFGKGHVWLFKGGAACRSSLKKGCPELAQGALYSVQSVTLSVLSAGATVPLE